MASSGTPSPTAGSMDAKRYSYTSTASYASPYMGMRSGMEGIDDDASLHRVPGLRERLELFIAPFFQDILNSVHNFVEIEVGAQLAAANKADMCQRPPGSAETLSHVRTGRRRSLSEEPRMPFSSIFSRGRSSIASSGNRRGSLASTAEEPKLKCPSSSPLADLADPRELREGSNVQAQDRSHSPRRHSEAPSEAENDADDDDEEDKSTPVCRHWKSKGWCRLSESCKFMHPEQKRGTGALPKKKSSRSRREASASLDDEDQAAGAPGRLKPRRGIGRSRQRGGEINVLPAQALAPGLISSSPDQH